VTVHLESMDGSTKRGLFVDHPNICEMKAVDWSRRARSLNHLCDLVIPKPVAHREVDLLIGGDYYEEILLRLEHHLGKPREPVGRCKDTAWMDSCWTCASGRKQTSGRQPCLHVPCKSHSRHELMNLSRGCGMKNL